MSISRTVCAVVFAIAAAAGGTTGHADEPLVPASEALGKIKVHADKIAAKFAEIEALYPKLGDEQQLARTFRDLQKEGEAIEASGRRPGLVLVTYAETWGAALASVYSDPASVIYQKQAYELDWLRDNVTTIGFARADELKAMDEGMQRWADTETKFRDAMANAVDLLKQELAVQFKLQVSNDEYFRCPAPPPGTPCRERLSGAIKGLTTDRDKLQSQYAEKKQSLIDMGKLAFDAVGMSRIRPFAVTDRLWAEERTAQATLISKAAAIVAAAEERYAKAKESFDALSKEDDTRRSRMAALKPKRNELETKIKAIFTARAKADGRRVWEMTEEQLRPSEVTEVSMLQKELAPIFLEYVRLEDESKAAIKTLEDSRYRLLEAQVARDLARDDLTARQDEMLAILHKPYITEVTASVDGREVAHRVYDPAQAEFAEKRDTLLATIALAKAAIEQTKPAHDAAYSDFKQAQRQAAASADELHGAILKNAAGQAVIKTAFYVWDVGWAAAEKGYAGALAEAVSKLVEEHGKNALETYGPPLFDDTDPNRLADQIVAQLRASVEDPLSSNQLAKSAVSFGTGEILTGRVKALTFNGLSAVQDRAARFFNPRDVAADLAGTQAARRSVLEKVTQAVKSFEAHRAAEYGVKAAGGAVIKEALKQVAGAAVNKIELDAWAKFLDLELRARLIHIHYEMANRAYQEARGILERSEADLKALNEHYIGNVDWAALMKTTKDEPFARDSKAVTVQVKARALPAKWQLAANNGLQRYSPSNDGATFQFCEMPSVHIGFEAETLTDEAAFGGGDLRPRLPFNPTGGCPR